MKKANWIKRITVMLSAAAMAFCLGIVGMDCYAKEGDEGGVGTSVSYVKEENEKFLLYVSIIGNGSLFDGEGIIRQQVNKYELEIGTIKTFRISPDQGYALDKVILNGKDVTNEVRSGKIAVYGESYEQHLEVYFKKINNAEKDINDKTNVTVQTGDTTKKGLSAIALISSLLVIIFIIKKKSEDEE